MRSGAEQSGSMVSVWGAPRSRAARAGLPRGVRAVAGGVPHPARPPCPCRGSSCPQLLRAPRRAPAPPSTPCSPGSRWARCGEPRVLAEPLTAPPPPSSDSPWSHGAPALRPGCRAQAATPQLSSGIQSRLHPLPCRCGASVGHVGCPGALPAAPGFLGREGRVRSPVLCLLSRGHPRVLTAVLVLAARFCRGPGVSSPLVVVIPNLYGAAGGDRGTPRSQHWEGRRDGLLLLTKGTNAYPCHCSLGRAAPTAPQMLRARCACRDPHCLPGRPSVPYPCAQNGSSAFLPADSQRGTGCSGNPVWFGCSSASAVPDDASNPWQQQDRGTECFGAHREGCSLRGASPGGKEGRKEAVGLTSAALSPRHCAVGDPPTSALQLSCKVS